MNNINFNRPSPKGLNYYPTEGVFVKALLDNIIFEGVVTEPCAGEGHIDKVWPTKMQCSDVHDYNKGIKVKDAFKINQATNIVTNPPYNIAFDLITHFLDIVDKKCAVLLRVSFLESIKRFKLFNDNPPMMVIIISNRMKVFDKTSQFPHCWIIWDKESIQPTLLKWWCR